MTSSKKELEPEGSESTEETEKSKEASVEASAETPRDESSDDSAGNDEDPAPLPIETFTGSDLKKERESRGMELKEISESTRIGVRSLQAVEEERFEDLPNARVYVRGFVRCYAEEVGLDPDAVAKSYLTRWASWFENEHSNMLPHAR